MKLLIWLLIGCIPFGVWAQNPYENQHTEIDVVAYSFKIRIHDNTDRIDGTATVSLRIAEDNVKKIDLDLIAQPEGSEKGMKVEMVEWNRSLLDFNQTDEELLIFLPNAMQKNETLDIRIVYSGIPTNGLIIGANRWGERTFFGDNWPNRARYWLPVVDHPSDKALVRWQVECPQNYSVVANGRSVEKNIVDKGYSTFVYNESVPIATKVMVFGAAHFATKEYGKLRNAPVSAWTYVKDSTRLFYDYAEALPIVSYFDSLIGPFSYAQLANVQSKTMFGGMENAGCIFYDETTIYGEPSDVMVRLVAHEIAHQWFGNGVTEKDYSHIWLSEGFATFLAAHYLEHKYSKDKLRQAMMSNRQMIQVFSEINPTTPVIDATQSDLMRLLNRNSYEKGGWVLNMLRAEVGDEAFWNILRKYYKTYKGANANTADFARITNEVAGRNMDWFFEQWLSRPGIAEFQLTWSVAGDKVKIRIEQTDKNLRQFKLGLGFSAIDNINRPETNIQSLEVKAQAINEFEITANNAGNIWVDPNTELLGRWELKKVEPMKKKRRKRSKK